MELLDNLQITEYRHIKLPLMESIGFFLAEDIVADHNSPEFPTSGMDGYAIKHKDLTLGKLKIASINPAGSDDKNALVGGTCIKTFTGSLMPEGSDTLIPIEYVRVENGHIIINEEVPCGFAVREVGENYTKNEKLIPKGNKIDFSQIGILASLNILEVEVYAKPRVVAISTGSELLDLGEPQTNDSQIRSSNNYTIEAIISKYGGEAVHHRNIKDDRDTIYNALSSALETNDIVVTTGGVSVGDFDFVKDVVYELGCEIVFRGVRVKPGQHIIVARKNNKFIVALPGFAYSATIMALIYLVPLMQKLQQGSFVFPKVKALLKEPFVKRAKKAEFTACNLTIENGQYFVDFYGKKTGTSAIMTNMLGDLALVYTEENDCSKDTGEEIDVVLL
ncbi:MAG: molybdopterin molybdotransferase MoeA [Sulfurovum sp.]|nr:molybdopterin molybdotransferase MoeA [Sulfurovum sp.]